jgi:transcription elongation factor Elf1
LLIITKAYEVAREAIMETARKTIAAIAPFSFECSVCHKNVGAGLLLDKGKGVLDLTCPVCARFLVYVEEFILPSKAPGLNVNIVTALK